MGQTSPLMQGKRGLVMGVANDRSIAWGIAKAAHEQGDVFGHERPGRHDGPVEGRIVGKQRGDGNNPNRCRHEGEEGVEGYGCRHESGVGHAKPPPQADGDFEHGAKWTA